MRPVIGQVEKKRLALLAMGKTPAALLAIMPVATGMAFTVLFLIWLDVLRRHKPIE